MQLIYNRNPQNEVLIIGDSLVRGVVCDNCDVAAVPGGRSEDLPPILSIIPIQCYNNFIVLIGADRYETRPKQGRLRYKKICPRDRVRHSGGCRTHELFGERFRNGFAL